jgi:hypothetical protein
MKPVLTEDVSHPQPFSAWNHQRYAPCLPNEEGKPGRSRTEPLGRNQPRIERQMDQIVVFRKHCKLCARQKFFDVSGKRRHGFTCNCAI